MLSYRRFLLLHEINQQKKRKNLNRKIENLSTTLQQHIGKLARIRVRNFINCQQQKFSVARKEHHSKLNNLGLEKRNITGDPNVITNLSNDVLTSDEHSALEKNEITAFFHSTLTSCKFKKVLNVFIKKLDYTSVLNKELKMVFILYCKYKSGYFNLKQHKTFNFDKEEIKAITNLHKTNLTVSKPDKGNGVVLLNKSDYIKKIENILVDKFKFKPVSNNFLKQLKKFKKTEFDQHLLHF